MKTKEFKPKSVKVGTMLLIDNNTGHMRCSVCGSEHYASIQPNRNGNYYRGSWNCVNKCRKERAK